MIPSAARRGLGYGHGVSDLAFVLVQRPAYPDPARVVASALAGGIRLTQTSTAGDSSVFELADGQTLNVTLMPAPYPDAARVPAGPTSPSPDEVAATPAHLIVTALGLEGTARE